MSAPGFCVQIRNLHPIVSHFESPVQIVNAQWGSRCCQRDILQTDFTLHLGTSTGTRGANVEGDGSGTLQVGNSERQYLRNDRALGRQICIRVAGDRDAALYSYLGPRAANLGRLE